MTIEESIDRYPDLAVCKRLVEDKLMNSIQPEPARIKNRIEGVMFGLTALRCTPDDVIEITNAWLKYIKDAADDCKDRLDQIMT